MTLHDLISEDYRLEQVRLHQAPRGYGQRGAKWAGAVQGLARLYRCQTVLDYGCGQGSLRAALLGTTLSVAEYDPAIRKKATLPAPADLVVCTDVLEHVEPDRIWAVLEHLRTLTRHALFTVISLVETEKRLSDGRQAHILLRSPTWWQAQFDAHGFRLARLDATITPQKPDKAMVATWVPEGVTR